MQELDLTDSFFVTFSIINIFEATVFRVGLGSGSVSASVRFSTLLSVVFAASAKVFVFIVDVFISTDLSRGITVVLILLTSLFYLWTFSSSSWLLFLTSVFSVRSFFSSLMSFNCCVSTVNFLLCSRSCLMLWTLLFRKDETFSKHLEQHRSEFFTSSRTARCTSVILTQSVWNHRSQPSHWIPFFVTLALQSPHACSWADYSILGRIFRCFLATPGQQCLFEVTPKQMKYDKP